jgi:predicted alpha/beta hydrolase family esterase
MLFNSLLEDTKVRGAILVSACHTDLGSDNERESGYYTGEWQWDRIKSNADWIVQYGSADDPFIPKEEMDLVHEVRNLAIFCWIFCDK